MVVGVAVKAAVKARDAEWRSRLEAAEERGKFVDESWSRARGRVDVLQDEAVRREKARKLSSVQQQLLGTGWVRHHMGAGRIQWRDVASEQECLTVLDEHVGVRQLGFLRPQTFDFPSLQSNTCFERVLDEVVVPYFFVLHDGVVREFCFLGFGH